MKTTALDRHGMARRDYAGASDATLVACFAAGRDQVAFAEIVRRHGPMVMSVARGVTRNESDAEDAFQATFLALATAAKRVRKQAAVAGWLQQAAVRTAKSVMRANHDWRRKAERKAQSTPDCTSPLHDDRAAILHEELQALPPKFRTAVVLCDLEGLTRKQAADRLGLPTATVISQVARGRQLLRERLVRRGVGLSMGGMAVRMAAIAKASAPINPACVQQTATIASQYAAGRTAAEIGISRVVGNSATGVIRATMSKQITLAGVAAVALIAFAGSVGGVSNSIMFSTASAATILDDFEDGNLRDGVPVTWSPVIGPGVANGDYIAEISTGPSSGDTLISTADGTVFENVSVRTQARMVEASLNTAYAMIFARSSSEGGYWGGVRRDGVIAAGRYLQDGTFTFHSMGSSLNPITNDILMQLNVVQNRISLTAWREGTPQPNPQVSFTDNTFQQGGVGLGLANGPARIAFRHFQAVPELSSLTLGTITLLGILWPIWRRRSRGD